MHRSRFDSARTPDISPDGKLIAFSYLGDIWTVEAIGGVARPVTMHEAHDIAPVVQSGRAVARVFLEPSRKLRRVRGAGAGWASEAPDLRFCRGHRQRLVARRQGNPIRIDAQYRVSADVRAVYRPGGRAAVSEKSRPQKERKASSRRPAIRLPTSEDPELGTARVITAPPTTTSGSATPTAPTTAN